VGIARCAVRGRRSAASLPNQLQTKASIELASVVRSTTHKTRNCATDFPNAREVAFAIRTLVEKPARAFDKREWQIVTALFIVDAKINTGRAPFCAVRRNSSSSAAKLRE